MQRKTVRLCAVCVSMLYMAAQMYVTADACGNGQRVVNSCPEYTAVSAVEQDVLPTGTPETSYPVTQADALAVETGAMQSPIGSRDWSGEESEILLKIAMAEAEGESTEGKALVMMVVLNRVRSDGFPDTIKDVVFQTAGGTYQFSPVAPGGRYWTAEPDGECHDALEMVMHGWDESRGALYFEACAGDTWHSGNLELLFECGGHRFYK